MRGGAVFSLKKSAPRAVRGLVSPLAGTWRALLFAPSRFCNGRRARSYAYPAMPLLFSSGTNPRRIKRKREPAEGKRRKETREFAMNGVGAQRSNHKGGQEGRGGAPVPGNQQTERAQEFKHADDVMSLAWVAPLREPFCPSHGLAACKFRHAGPDGLADTGARRQQKQGSQ